jgi:prolipoprotein diacylglyceryltransferase
MLFALYLALYALGRFAVTFGREDKIWALGMQEAHYIALLVLAITVPLLVWKARWVPKTADDQAATEAAKSHGTRAERRRRERSQRA